MIQPRLLLGLALAVAPSASLHAQASGLAATYRAAADSLIHAATRDSAAYGRLARLVDGFGHRESGSRSLEAAIDWILSEMKKDGLQNVRGEPVQVTHWVRGMESAVLTKPRLDTLHMLGLGGSVATPTGGITATVLVVSSFDELERRKAEARGKIVLFDVPFTDYEATRRYRTDGPSAAARAGAVACLIRSVASFSIRSPHTGRTTYDSTVARIPAAALSVEDAMMLRRMQERGEPVVVTLKMGARQLAPSPVAQRGGGAGRAGEAGRGRRAGRPHRLLGRGAGGGGRCRRLGGRVGGRPADEAAGAPPAPDRAGGPVDQRRERGRRRPRLSGRAPSRPGPST